MQSGRRLGALAPVRTVLAWHGTELPQPFVQQLVHGHHRRHGNEIRSEVVAGGEVRLQALVKKALNV